MNDDYTLKMSSVNATRILYHGEAAYVDKEVGRMVDWVDDKGLASSTLLIFTSDHGSMLYVGWGWGGGLNRPQPRPPPQIRPRHRQRQALVP